METSETKGKVNSKHQRNKSVEDRATAVALARATLEQKLNASEPTGRLSQTGEVDEWIAQQRLPEVSEDILGRSTPVDKSFENEHQSYDEADAGFNLDVSRVEIAEELQKQQSERLEKLWKRQSEQSQKIFEKLDESMIWQKRNSRLREQHARQMEDMKRYYEGEISTLKKQLAGMKNALYQHNKHEQSVKAEIQKEFENLSAVNIELSSKCDALQSAKRLMGDQLKQTNGEKQTLETQCQQLVATNHIIDARSREMKKSKEETGTRLKEIEEEQKTLQSRCDVLSKEKALLTISKEELERNYSQLQEQNQKLTDRCHKWKEESKVFRDRHKTQENLLEKTNKQVRELERVIETLKKESEDDRVKFEVDRSLFNATQQRVDRLVVQNRDKDLIIQDLEAKVQHLEATMKDVAANTAKAGLNEIKESIKRDKELLKRVVREYDSLNLKHEKTKDQVERLENKLAESREVGEHLRRELSEVNITRRNLENSLRQVLGNQDSCRRMVERSTRRTWEQSENFNFYTGEPVRHDNDVDRHAVRIKVSEKLESTRRENSESDKNEMIDLSLIQSDDVGGPGYPEVLHDREKYQPQLDLAQDGTLTCKFCRQVTVSPVQNNKDKPLHIADGNDSKKHDGLVKTHPKNHAAKNQRTKFWKEKENLPSSKGNWIKKVRAEVDAQDRRASIVSAEKRFLELSEQRRRLEAALVKISSSRMTKENREDKNFLEEKLDEILKEIGKTRLVLRGEEID